MGINIKKVFAYTLAYGFVVGVSIIFGAIVYKVVMWAAQ